MKSRAAEFTSQPQAVEVYQAGTWWAGELLGWRHEPDGSCQVRVRVTLGGVEETAWADLATLRLPEQRRPMAAEPATRADASATQKLPRATSPRTQGADRAEPAVTAGMPAVRDLSVVHAASRPGGRRRAPEDATVTTLPTPRSGGRRRAPEEVETAVAAAAPRPGGRRRAPEEPDVVDAGKHRAASSVEAMSSVDAGSPVEAGSSAEVGRHRKVGDTGLFPAVSDPLPVTTIAAARPAPPSRRDDTLGGRTRAAWSAVGEAEPDLLTRPMRLSDQIPHARRPRLDGSLTEV